MEDRYSNGCSEEENIPPETTPAQSALEGFCSDYRHLRQLRRSETQSHCLRSLRLLSR